MALCCYNKRRSGERILGRLATHKWTNRATILAGITKHLQLQQERLSGQGFVAGAISYACLLQWCSSMQEHNTCAGTYCRYSILWSAASSPRKGPVAGTKAGGGSKKILLSPRAQSAVINCGERTSLVDRPPPPTPSPPVTSTANVQSSVYFTATVPCPGRGKWVPYSQASGLLSLPFV